MPVYSKEEWRLKMKQTKNKLEEEIIRILLKISKRGEGALIIVGDRENIKYTSLVEQTVPSFNIKDNPKLLESLALMDGAVVLDKDGNLISYGSKLKSDKIMKNFGTKHSAGLSVASIEDNIAFLLSEEESKIKIFKHGKIIMQIDALEKGIENKTSEISKLLESLGIGTLGSFGVGVVATSVGVLGVTFIPGVLVFGGTYYLINKLNDWRKRG
jgi:3-deoxy-D-manno-octulosonate 8-phosphate phosphatase KdsC-like HAD superfamily phosphatase